MGSGLRLPIDFTAAGVHTVPITNVLVRSIDLLEASFMRAAGAHADLLAQTRFRRVADAHRMPDRRDHAEAAAGCPACAVLRDNTAADNIFAAVRGDIFLDSPLVCRLAALAAARRYVCER